MTWLTDVAYDANSVGRDLSPSSAAEAASAVADAASTDGAAAIDMQFLDQFRQLDPAGGLGLVRQIMKVYLDTSPENVRKVEQAVTAGDAESLRRAAHMLKSSSANVGAARLSDLFRQLEMMGKSSQLEEARALLDRMRRAYRDATEEIRNLVAEGQS